MNLRSRVPAQQGFRKSFFTILGLKRAQSGGWLNSEFEWHCCFHFFSARILILVASSPHVLEKCNYYCWAISLLLADFAMISSCILSVNISIYICVLVDQWWHIAQCLLVHLVVVYSVSMNLSPLGCLHAILGSRQSQLYSTQLLVDFRFVVD